MAMLAPECETDDCAVATTVVPLSLRRLLEWLGDGMDSDAGRYAEMRRRLVAYFDRRNRHDAGALADETFGRLSAALEGGTLVETVPPARCCYLMATRVLNEAIARDERYVDSAGQLPQSGYCCDDIERCILELPADQRQLLLEYYCDPLRAGTEHRRRLAERMCLTATALGVRAFQMRDAVMARAQRADRTHDSGVLAHGSSSV